ncbi:MAG: DUF488 family protein [Solirubrobacteraceae bacterium]|nr:DUF488 family protein [Solirubrobacteraceae bacterium]
MRISLGKPKFWPEAAAFAYVHELAPAGLLDLHGREFAEAYLTRLDRHGDRILDRLAAVENPGLPLALLCFEANPAQCHRSTAAQWLERVTGVPVFEFSPTPTML